METGDTDWLDSQGLTTTSEHGSYQLTHEAARLHLDAMEEKYGDTPTLADLPLLRPA